ncbi:MFS transporter [Mycobacterium sp. C31M]
MRPWIIWATGLLAYIVAVLNRTTLGVSGLEAGERFHAGPSVLSTFVVLQIIVYAGAQVPAGVLLDRYGSKLLIVTGGALMVAGQLAIAVTDSLALALAARAVVGLGDAVTFISVLRLVPHWFPARRVPLLTQLTGISGQLGQILSAVPFLALLGIGGWTSAYLTVAAFAVIALVLAATLVQNTPDGKLVTTTTMSVRGSLASVHNVWMRPGTRLGFFTHLGTQFSVTTFCLMWGVPYVTTAQGQPRSVAGMLLTISVVTAIAAGVVLGILCGRFPHRRSWFVLAIIGSNALIWTIVLALPGAAPLWLLITLVVVISVGGPGSMVGFDFARTFNPSSTLGTAQGMVNMGGFLASLLLMQAMGLILDAAGGYSPESFRLAWTLQYLVWALAVVGILVTRRKTRRQLGLQGNASDRILLETFEPQAAGR